MKNILKICVIAVLTLSMLLCIVACTGDGDDKGTSAPTDGNQPTNAPAGPTEEDPTEEDPTDEDPTEEPTEESQTIAQVTDGNGYADWNPIG